MERYTLFKCNQETAQKTVLLCIMAHLGDDP